MGCMLILAAMAVTGVDVGWQQRPDGGFEYIIQIEPQLIEALKQGEEIGSEIDPKLRHVRNYRIICGDKPLPRDPIPPPLEPPKTGPTPQSYPAKESKTPTDSEKPSVLFWLAWGIAGGFFSAFVYLLLIHMDTRRRYHALVAEWFATHDDAEWSFTQTDSPSEP